MIACIIQLFLLVCLSGHEVPEHDGHTCIHGNVKSEETKMHINYNLPPRKPKRRNLQASRSDDPDDHLFRRPDESFQHIRIRPYWTHTIENLRRSPTELLLRMLIKNMVTSAVKFLEKFTKVVRIPGALVLPSDGFCPNTQIPIEFYAHGTSGHHGAVDTDLLILVSFQLCSSDNTLAWAMVCIRDQHNRPIVGHLNICQGLAKKRTKIEYVSSVLLHEIGHIVVMSFGRPTSRYTPKLWSWKNDNEVSPFEYMKEYNGKYYIATKGVKEHVANFFGCDQIGSEEIPGAQLEDQGGGGTSMTHWDERYYHSETMCGQAWEVRAYWSNLTLALMEDTGWYMVDYAFAEPRSFGKGKGCAFLRHDAPCITGSQALHKQYYCTDKYDDGCTYDYLTVADCYYRRLKDPRQIEEAKRWEWSRGGHGGNILSDYCPFRDVVKKPVTPFCGDERGQGRKMDRRGLDNVYGIDSRCVPIEVVDEGTLGYCTKVRCDYNPTMLTVYLPHSRKLYCSPNDSLQAKDVSVGSNQMWVSTFNATDVLGETVWNPAVRVICPNVETICGVTHPFACRWGWWVDVEYFHGCVCVAGFDGEDCSEEYHGTIGIDSFKYPPTRFCAAIVFADTSDESLLFRFERESSTLYKADEGSVVLRGGVGYWQLEIQGYIFTCNSHFAHGCEFEPPDNLDENVGPKEVRTVFACPGADGLINIQSHEADIVPNPGVQPPVAENRVMASFFYALYRGGRILSESGEFLEHNWPFVVLTGLVMSLVLSYIAEFMSRRFEKKQN